MSEFEKQSLSALLDGESDELELRRILRSSEKDPELLQTWGRYNVVQAALHGEAVSLTSSNLAARVAAELEFEAPLKRASGVSATLANMSDWQKGLAKMAVAASVALVFLVSLDSLSEPASRTAEIAADTNSALMAPAIAANLPVIMDPEALKRLEDYISATAIDDDEPVRLEHIQDSPLFRLVNRLQEK